MSHFALFLYFPFKFSLSYSLLLTFFLFCILRMSRSIIFFCLWQISSTFQPKNRFFFCVSCYSSSVSLRSELYVIQFYSTLLEIFFFLFRNHKAFIAFFTNFLVCNFFFRVHLKYLLYTQKFTSFNLKIFNFLLIYQHK